MMPVGYYYSVVRIHTLLVRAEPRQSMTALEVKFSLAISSKLDHCLV